MTQKKALKLEAERARVEGMRRFENELVTEHLRAEDTADGVLGKAGPGTSGMLICGVDEAGRGPLAGPVAAGAVILPPDHDLLYINDSKKLSEKRREKLYDEICADAVAWAVGIVEPGRIDEINILQATYEAMRIAISKLDPQPAVLINDAVTIPGVKIRQIPVVKGDAKCISIAAASILAKVTRDRIMREMDALYPAYGFAGHKGYGTKAHIEAILEHGPCPIHRASFIGKILQRR